MGCPSDRGASRLSTTIGAFAGVVLLGLLGLLGVVLYQRGYVRLNYPSSDEYPVRGVDVSHHQGRVDWDAVDVDFAYLKATEGGDFTDTRFEENWAGARGVARGPYHFFTFCTPGRAQAEHFLGTIPGDAELPPAVDVEFAGNCTSWDDLDDVRSELEEFVRIVEEATGREPVLYVTRRSFDEVVRGVVDAKPLWLREVVRHPSKEEFPALTFWQYAGNGRVDGIGGLVDLDVFVGGRSEFADMVRTSGR